MNIPRILLGLLLALAFQGHALAGPISKGGTVITKPGKYYLIRNITVAAHAGFTDPFGIAIMSSNVELDLAGFSIGPAPNQTGVGTGIWLGKSFGTLRVQNGRIQGVNIGVQVDPTGTISESIFERLQIASCVGDGVQLRGGGLVVRNCTVTNVTATHLGFSMLGFFDAGNEISDCTVLIGGAVGISSVQTGNLLVRRCFVNRCTIGYGMTATCKLVDNLTTDCNTKVTGNPVLAGVNN